MSEETIDYGQVTGMVHSTESFGAVDGPGIDVEHVPLFLKKTFLLTILLKHDLLTNRIYLQ